MYVCVFAYAVRTDALRVNRFSRHIQMVVAATQIEAHNISEIKKPALDESTHTRACSLARMADEGTDTIG